MSLPKIIVICGTNASGKSNLAVEEALGFHGEIVSADSRQVYKRLDLGSGKITVEEMKGVPHHLLDIVEPGMFYSMADYQKDAYAAIDGILATGRLPILAGGSGLYIDAVADGYCISHKMPDLDYRNELEKLSTPELFQMLQACRPDIEVDSHNRNRVMRYLEKIHDGDDVSPARVPRYEVLRIGVTWERSILRERIDERLDRRLKEGMVEEVANLIKDGVSEEFLLKLGLEYKFLTQYLQGKYSSFEEMKALLATAIKQFAKRQMIWFRRNQDIHWLDMEKEPAEEAAELIHDFLRE